MPTFETRIVLSRPRVQVFDFLVRTSNLIDLIPKDSGMQVISVPEIIEPGSRLEFRANAFGQTLDIVHEITELVTPEKITEVQVKGLFKKFVHEHVVEEGPGGEVVAIDRIQFEPPGGLLGFVVTAKRIQDQFASLFNYRHQQMRRLLG
ncbi:MAG: hypothetical protein JSS02_20210 [Planctomycetes bacterium]|nr:hypothetical protein [Planctomycetota bacterium]